MALCGARQLFTRDFQRPFQQRQSKCRPFRGLMGRCHAGQQLDQLFRLAFFCGRQQVFVDLQRIVIARHAVINRREVTPDTQSILALAVPDPFKIAERAVEQSRGLGHQALVLAHRGQVAQADCHLV